LIFLRFFDILLHQESKNRKEMKTMKDKIPKNIPPELQAILRKAWKRRRQKRASMSVEERMKHLREARMKGYMSEELEKELAARWGWDVDASGSSDVQPS